MGLIEERAYKRTIEQTEDEAKELRNKVARLGIEVRAGTPGGKARAC